MGISFYLSTLSALALFFAPCGSTVFQQHLVIIVAVVLLFAIMGRGVVEGTSGLLFSLKFCFDSTIIEASCPPLRKKKLFISIVVTSGRLLLYGRVPRKAIHHSCVKLLNSRTIVEKRLIERSNLFSFFLID